MMDMQNLTWLRGQPLGSGVIKASPEDFQVTEDLGFEPDGDGEHLLLRVRKIGCNTRFVADALAKFFKVSARDVSFAGQKDRHAITEQWFCVRLPGKAIPEISAFTLADCEILEFARHRRKLRLGSLKGNAFKVILRNISDRCDTDMRLQTLAKTGVPNYFGRQRFGINGNNLQQALRWAESQAPLRDRTKRSFWLSATRSALFNHIVSTRLAEKDLNQVISGDALQLAGRGSWFVATAEEHDVLQARVDSGELLITAVLPGSGEWGSREAALAFEQACVAEEESLLGLLRREGVEAARRAMLVKPQSFRWDWLDDRTVELNFWLPAGSFATSLVRELVNIGDEELNISE